MAPAARALGVGRSPREGRTAICQALAQDNSGNLWASVLGSGVLRLKRRDLDTIRRYRRTAAGAPRSPSCATRVIGYGSPIPVAASPCWTVARPYLWRCDGLQIGNVMAIQSGRIGHWFGGEFGLARLEGGQFYAIATGADLPLESSSRESSRRPTVTSGSTVASASFTSRRWSFNAVAWITLTA